MTFVVYNLALSIRLDLGFDVVYSPTASPFSDLFEFINTFAVLASDSAQETSYYRLRSLDCIRIESTA